jgi:hypothetical protein
VSGLIGTSLDRRCVYGAEKSCFPQTIFRLLVYFAVIGYLSFGNADPAQESEAEATLAGKIKCEDFRKNHRWHLDQWSQCENLQ